MSSTITYAPHPDATPEDEITALASAYAFVRACAEMRRSTEKKKGGAGHTADDAMERFEGDSADTRLP
jgi:hypothetical protein